MNGLTFAVAIAHDLAWPVAVVLAVVLMRRQLAEMFGRVRSVEFAGGRATFDALGNYEKLLVAATKDEVPAEPATPAPHGEAELAVLNALTDTKPRRAVIDGWGLLENQLNAACDRIAPDQPHGWPQVARTLDAWAPWYVLSPAVQELKRLRDITVESNQSPTSEDAARYVSVVEELVTTLRTAGPPEGESGG